jgi:hypothetical protein
MNPEGKRTLSWLIPIFNEDLNKPKDQYIKPKQALLQLNAIFQALYDHDEAFTESILEQYPLGTHILEHLPEND